MQKMNDVLRCLILFVAIGEVLAAFAAEPPLMMIRLRGPHTADDAQWAKTFKALKENRAACDEVWFSTGIGFPKMEWHEAHVSRLKGYAEQLRAVGIVPSLQFQATLGHSVLADGKNVIWCDFNDRFLEPDGTATKEVFTDFCHLTEKGYGIWRDAMLPHFREACGK